MSLVKSYVSIVSFFMFVCIASASQDVLQAPVVVGMKAEQIVYEPVAPELGDKAAKVMIKHPVSDFDNTYFVRFKLSPHGQIKSHSNDQQRYVTVLKGDLYLLTEVENVTTTTKYAAGSFLVLPADVVYGTMAKDSEVIYQEVGQDAESLTL